MNSTLLIAIAAIVLGLIVFGLLWMFYMGFFIHPKVELKEMEEMLVVNYNYTGLMKDYMKGMQDCEKKVKKIIPSAYMFKQMGGVYWTDPAIVKVPEDNKWSIFFVMEEGSDVMKKFMSEPPTDEYCIVRIPKCRAAYTSFPFRNFLSYMIAPSRVYPALHKFMKENDLTPKGCMEFYYDSAHPSEYTFYIEDPTNAFSELQKSKFVAAHELLMKSLLCFHDMDLNRFEFALFIKDESVSSKEFKNRTVLYQDEICNLYILMRRKKKDDMLSDWRLPIQTIHAMVFLVSNAKDENGVIKKAQRPLIYKDMLLSAFFKEIVESEAGKDLPTWLVTSLESGLFDCFYKCSIKIALDDRSREYYTLYEGKNRDQEFFLQALIKPCPSHFSTYQVSNQINCLPQYPQYTHVDNPTCKTIASLSLLQDSTDANNHVSLSLPILLHNNIDLQVSGENGEMKLQINNRSTKSITITGITNYICDVVFVTNNEKESVESASDFSIVNSYELPNHDPTIIHDIHNTAIDFSAPVTIEPDKEYSIQSHVEYTQNHALSFTAQNSTESMECDVYITLTLTWKENEALFPLIRNYDIKARLHPKPQIEIVCHPEADLLLYHPAKLTYEITNLSSHSITDAKIVVASQDSLDLNSTCYEVSEFQAHSTIKYTIQCVPKHPGVLNLPYVKCMNRSGKTIPSLHNSSPVIVKY